MKKGILIAAAAIVMALIATVFALNPTVFTDLKATNFQVGTIYDAAGTSAKITFGTSSTTISTMTITGSAGFRLGYLVPATSTATMTPSGIGVLIMTSNNELVVSTAATRGSWQKVGAQ